MDTLPDADTEEKRPEKRKAELSSLDLYYLVPELRRALAGGVFRKIYNYGKKEFRFEVLSARGDIFWLYSAPGMLFLTDYRKESPPEPTSFCMFLRKHLLGRRISDVRQHEFDRIVEIHAEDCTLILELMHPCNAILADSMMAVVMPAEIQVFRDRAVKPKMPYRYPPKPPDMTTIQAHDFARLVHASDRRLGVFLASVIGPFYAEEACARASLSPEKDAAALHDEETEKLYHAVRSMLMERPEPAVYGNAVAPFRLKSLRTECKGFQTFSEALDAFFSPAVEKEQELQSAKATSDAGTPVNAAAPEVPKALREEAGRIARIEQQQQQAVEKYAVKKEEKREEADIIYEHYGTVQSVLEAISRAKESGMPWSELKSRIAQEQTPEAEAIKEIREHDGIVVLRLGGKDVEIDFRKSAEENAAVHYEEMKKAKRKAAGAGEAMKALQERKQTLLETATKLPAERKQLMPTPQRRKKWHEKFHWFTTSDGSLVVGGKDAKQNEMIFAKYMDSEDYVFHADIHGASLVVAKGKDGHKPSEVAIKEASEFAAAHCKAWSKSLTEVDVFCVGPSQVSKSPPTGTFLPQGSFIISGQRLWFHDVELKLAIGVAVEEYGGVRQGRVLAGPVMAMRRHALAFVTVKPGFKMSAELAKEIRTMLLQKLRPEDKPFIEALPLQDFQAAIPSGTGDIMDMGRSPWPDDVK